MPVEQHDPSLWIVERVAAGGVYCFVVEEATGECRLEDELGRRLILDPVDDPVHHWVQITPTYPDSRASWCGIQCEPALGQSLFDAHLVIRVSAPRRYSISERLNLGGLYDHATQVARDYRDFFGRWFPPKRLELKIESLW